MTSADFYGHLFGPDSIEVADGILRLDETLQDFFLWLDQTLGRNRTLLFLTSDHGLTPIPEATRAKLHEKNQSEVSGRLDIESGESGKISDLTPERLLLEEHLAKRFDYTLDRNRPSPVEAAVRKFSNSCLYLNKEVLKKRGVPAETAKEEVPNWVKTRPSVLTAYTNTEIGNGLPDSALFATAVMRSFRPDRSGDVFILLRPGWIWNVGPDPIGTSHGSPYEEDIHVPLLVWGAKVKRGSFEEPVSPLSIAKTIAAIFQVRAGAEDVAVLQPALGK